MAVMGTEPDAGVVAIHLSREDADFLPSLLAVSRAGARCVLLSKDLPDAELQRSRNDFAIKTLQPWLVIGDGPDAVLPAALAAEAASLNGLGQQHPTDPGVLCYMFTGGTFRTKVVAVTHRMFIHERKSYWEIWAPRHTAVVLAHTSVYWAASALGQLSIALAYGGTAVLTEIADIAKLQRCVAEEKVNVLGVVPEHLDLLAPRPQDFPEVEMIFTWGERLPHQLAQRWRGHGALLRELLISTEYWLCCWADPLADGLLRPVQAAQLLVLTDAGQDAAEGELGLLCIAGPMVMAGYTGGEDAFRTINGQRYFCTSDLVRRVGGGIVFKGRADMMAKSAGKWVDMTEVEDAVGRVPGVLAVKIIADSSTEQFHLFASLAPDGVTNTLDAVRSGLPPKVQVWVIPELPRHPVTRKVDLAQLRHLARPPEASWPLEPGAGKPELRSRLWEHARSQALWTLAAVGTTWVCACPQSQLASQLGGTIAWLGALRLLPGLWPRLGVTAVWLLTSFNKALVGRYLVSSACLIYSWLALTLADDARQRDVAWGLRIFRIVDVLPLWKFGFFISTALLRHLPFAGIIFGGILGAATAGGLAAAAGRGRLLAWPVVFLLGIGHQLQVDCRGWMHWETWRSHASQLLAALRCLCTRPSTQEWTSYERRTPTEPEEKRCDCGEVPQLWLGHKVLCGSCAATLACSSRDQAAAFLEGVDEGEVLEPQPKRARRKADQYLDRMQILPQPADPAEIQKLEHWWWYHHTGEEIHELPDEGVQEQLCQEDIDLNPTAQLLCTALGEVQPLLKPLRMSSVLLGLDSLRIARLANLLRSKFGCVLTAPQIRSARTVEELCQLLEAAEKVPESCCEDIEQDAGKEYAVWFSPGQVSPMGHWVLRKDGPVHRAALTSAVQRLVQRHKALRLQMNDCVRYLSFVFDAGVLFTMYAPLLEASVWPLRLLRRCLSYGLERGWPRVKVHSQREIYGSRNPEALPLETIQITDGQAYFEAELKRRRFNLKGPVAITGYELICHMEGTWLYERWRGNFVICPGHAEAVQGLSYVDAASGEWGPLLSPLSAKWERPPYGFPALFFVPLSSGASLWLRLDSADSLHVCYLEQKGGMHHLAAKRASDIAGDPVVVSFIGICMLHAFADGNCYLPLVQDLMSCYEARAMGAEAPRLAPIEDGLAEQQRRLSDSLNHRPSPTRCSLRGGIWRFNGRGYSHSIGLLPSAVAVISKASARYRLPLDVVLLGLVVCAMAQADRSDTVEITLYAPMRDGTGEAMAVGLFSDWRDLFLRVDFQFATVLGTVLHLYHKIQHRQWTVYNCLRKPERHVVNVQPLDFERKGGLMHVGENLWHGGDQLSSPEIRDSTISHVHQPLTVVVEQQDEDSWWVLVSAAYPDRPTPWMRRFVQAFHECTLDFLQKPTARVHRKLPDDNVLLSLFRRDATDAGFM
ncbi:unnamed protein product [Effrenium voratum]|uniref:Carrier domain-containing protein n=1 Tax=Effrenium voratum TaxID=2562239 RepID=A0AA36NL86_9DINO|nr:unnamed protein product [Effrenium voratum]